MNKLQYLFIHCSATPAMSPKWNAARIKQMHMDPVANGGRGWDRPGYRSIIEYDGHVEKLVDANDDAFVQPNEVTWGVGPAFNGISHHICYVGGLDARGQGADTRTTAQVKAMLEVVQFYLRIAPDIKIIGHNQVANKACPGFFVPRWGAAVGIAAKNLDQRDPFGYGKIFPA